jgi:hypothetical protein
VLAGALSKAPGLSVGFRKGKPCTDNLSIWHGVVIYAFIKDKGTIATFLDVKSAYNSVLPDILDEKF